MRDVSAQDHEAGYTNAIEEIVLIDGHPSRGSSYIQDESNDFDNPEHIH